MRIYIYIIILISEIDVYCENDLISTHIHDTELRPAHSAHTLLCLYELSGWRKRYSRFGREPVDVACIKGTIFSVRLRVHNIYLYAHIMHVHNVGRETRIQRRPCK